MNCKYIRTKDGRLFKTKDYFMLPLDYPKFSVYGSNETFYEGHVEGADSIFALVREGDLLIIEDRATSYPYKTFPYVYGKTPFAFDCAVYRLLELYTKNSKGDYVLVAKRNKEEMELL